MNIFKAQACPLRRSMLQASACLQACSSPLLAREHAWLCCGASSDMCVCVCVCVMQTLGRAAKSASGLGAPAPSLSRAVHVLH